MNSEHTEFEPSDASLEYDEEWLSAYLDDELSDAQRHIVEGRLAVDPVAAATLADLQRVRSLVRQLPTWNGPNVQLSDAELTSAEQNLEDNAQDEFEDELEMEHELEFEAQELTPADSQSLQPRWNKLSRRSSSSGGSSVSWLRPLVIAASLLLMAGIGYVLWPTSQPQLASSRSTDTNAESAQVESESLPLEKPEFNDALPADGGRSNSDLARLEQDAMQGAAPPPAAMSALPQPNNADLASLPPADRMVDPQEFNRALTESDQPPADRQQKEAEPLADSRLAAPHAPEKSTNDLPSAPSFGSEAPLSARVAPSMADPAAQPQAAPAPKQQISQQDPTGENFARENPARENPTVVDVYVGRSSSWSDAELANELAQNAVLSSIADEPLQQLGLSSGASNRQSRAPIVIGRLPAKVDGREVFEVLVASNRLTATVLPRQGTARQPLGGGRDNITETASAAEPPPPGAATTGSDSQLSQPAPGPAASAQTIVLFLSRDEATHILESMTPTATDDRASAGNQEDTSATTTRSRFTWIEPAQQPNQPASQQVILLLNTVE
ncbi:MAG: hypothetical protein R3C53_08030 [Pirellulaceae bacterium]